MLLMNSSKRLNPAAANYAPESQPQNKTTSQVSLDPSPDLEARVFKLEEGHSGLREEIDSLAELYHNFCSSVETLKKGGWPVMVDPFQEQDLTHSHQSAIAFKQKLEELSRQVHE
jgi:hypothetical protein